MYSVADIKQSLIDDALVDEEKIGGSNYFWSFPAKKDRLLQIQYQQNVETLDNMRASVEESSARLVDFERVRHDVYELSSCWNETSVSSCSFP
jgi:hypothetical protein